MSSSEYRASRAGHIHAGRELQPGDVVTIPDDLAKRYPEVFERVVPMGRQEPRMHEPAAGSAGKAPQSK